MEISIVTFILIFAQGKLYPEHRTRKNSFMLRWKFRNISISSISHAHNPFVTPIIQIIQNTVFRSCSKYALFTKMMTAYVRHTITGTSASLQRSIGLLCHHNINQHHYDCNVYRKHVDYHKCCGEICEPTCLNVLKLQGKYTLPVTTWKLCSGYRISLFLAAI